MASTYFSEDHPENAPLRDWIKQYRNTHHLASSADMWLHVLRYYLDTPHHQILLDAKETMSKHGGVIQYHQKLKHRVDPDDKHYPAVAYDKQANMSYLGVWQAADDEEFVLGHNSFGLWEGLVGGQPEVHRLFLVSPKLMVVLRTNVFRPDVQHAHGTAHLLSFIDSDLSDIAMATPAVQYHDVLPEGGIPAEMLNDYRATNGALDDVFTFNITKLTPAQTYAVNRVMMINVSPTGSLTFTSNEIMLRTLKAYMADPVAVIQGPPRYHLLLRLLEPTPTPPVPPSSHSRVHEPEPEPVYLEPHEMIDIPLFTMVIEIVSGAATYPSRFASAFAVLMHLKHNKALKTEFLSEHHFLLTFLRSSLIPCPPESRPSLFRTHAEASVLMKHIPQDVYERIFRSILNWGVAETPGFGHASDRLSRLRDEVVIVAFVDWTARRQPDVYQTLLDGRHDVFKYDNASNDSDPAGAQSNAKGKGKAPASAVVEHDVSGGSTQDDLRSGPIADELLSAYLYQVKHARMEFRSKYDRAFAVYQRATAHPNMTNPFSTQIRDVVADLAARFMSVLRPPPSPESVRPMTLVDSCSRQDSKAFFHAMSVVGEKLGFAREPGGGFVVNLLDETTLVGLASSLARERPDAIGLLFQGCDLQMLVAQD